MAKNDKNAGIKLVVFLIIIIIYLSFIVPNLPDWAEIVGIALIFAFLFFATRII